MRASRRLLSAILTFMLIFSMCGMAFADEDEDINEFLAGAITTATESGFVSTDRWINANCTTDGGDGTTPLGTVNNQTIYLKKGVKMEDFKSQMTKSINNSKVVSNVNNMTDAWEIGADVGNAAKMLSGFTPIISLVVGIMVTLITIGMTIFSAFDIAYIAFPVFRNKCEEAKVNGGPGTKTTANGETKLRWITDDAQYAVTQGSVESGKSPWTIYFRKRVMSYIMLAIILFILMTGNISLITNIAVNVVSGIMNVLSGLAA